MDKICTIWSHYMEAYHMTLVKMKQLTNCTRYVYLETSNKNECLVQKYISKNNGKIQDKLGK